MTLTSGDYDAQANRLRSQWVRLSASRVQILRPRGLRQKPRRASACQNFRGAARSILPAYVIPGP
jgi:hypothetical protein